MQRKIINYFIIIFIILVLTACGKNEKNIEKTSNVDSNLAKVGIDLSKEDFKWEISPRKCNGYDCYVVSLTNNSKYDIIGVHFSYKVKDGVTESQLNVYDKFMKDHARYIKEDDSPKDVTLGANKNVLVQKGEQISGLKLNVGFKNWFWYDYPTDEQFNLMEPKEFKIGIVNGNTLYYAYYIFKSNSWLIDEKSYIVDKWTENEIGKRINKPECIHYVIEHNEETNFEINAYGVTKDTYKKYVSELKNNGFSNNSHSYDYSFGENFTGENSEKYEVDVMYYEETNILNIKIRKW